MRIQRRLTSARIAACQLVYSSQAKSGTMHNASLFQQKVIILTTVHETLNINNSGKKFRNSENWTKIKSKFPEL